MHKNVTGKEPHAFREKNPLIPGNYSINYNIVHCVGLTRRVYRTAQRAQDGAGVTQQRDRDMTLASSGALHDDNDDELVPSLADLFDESRADEEGELDWSEVDVGHGLILWMSLSHGFIWGSALNLSRYLASEPRLVAGKSVVELGASAGLPCLVSAKLGATTALGTDVDAPGVELIGKGAARNGLDEVVHAARLDWFDALTSSPLQFGSFDVVL